MSYTMLDWLGDQTREDHAFNKAARNELVNWMREDGRMIVRKDHEDCIIAHIRGFEHDHGICEDAVDFYLKEAKDWEK